MKVCDRALNRFQIYNENGDVRLCGWAKDQYIGSLLDSSVEELYCGERARKFIDRHVERNFDLCIKDACGYLSRNKMDEIEVEYKEQKYPEQLAIGFERVCNYACPSCTLHCIMQDNSKDTTLEEKYDLIEKRIREALPHVKSVSANGCGELFVSKRTLKLLSEWDPIADDEECYVGLETNGSLFDEEHWSQISNLAKYRVSVCVTVMSFQEPIYQYLSGCNLSINRILKNLLYVKGLREKGDINELIIGTVVQEQNFREMPEFTRRCIEEFGADKVRLRPFEPWGAESPDEAWQKDIRIPDHPLHQEWKKVFSDPIFKDPRVLDNSGGLTSEWTKRSPYKNEIENEKIMAEVVCNPERMLDEYRKHFGDMDMVIYGTEPMGRIVSKSIQTTGIRPKYLISYLGGVTTDLEMVKLSDIDDSYDREVGVIITQANAEKKIRYELESRGYKHMITINELMKDYI